MTTLFRLSDCWASSRAEASTWPAAAPVSLAAWLTPAMLDVTSWVPVEACSTLRAISLVAALCSSTAAAMVEAMALISPIVLPIVPIASNRLLGRRLNLADLGADLLGRLGRLVGQVLDLGGHHGEALAGFPGAGRLDGGVKRQQVGLVGDVGDQRHHRADLLRGVDQALDHLLALLGLAHRAGRDRGSTGPPGG